MKFPKRRQRVADLACRSLEDKSSNVRRNAIKLLTRLVETHPFGALHSGTLKRSEWVQQLQAVEAELTAIQKPIQQEIEAEASMVEDDGDSHEQEDDDSPEASRPTRAPVAPPNEEEIRKLQGFLRFYTEGVRFIETVHTASSITTQLLGSKNKSEVIEAMDFFKCLDIHRIETSKQGIRKMLRLIWTKGNSDEGRGIQAHLIEVYKDLFFNAPQTFNAQEQANYIARNMISLTFNTSAAELTSLEQLLSKMMTEGHISELVVQKLWQTYSVPKGETTRTQRRGAIIVLGMLALAEPEIIVRELELVLKIGLGALGRADLGLGKYSCLALRHISPIGRKGKDAINAIGKLKMEHPIMLRLSALVELPSTNSEWFGVAEHALSAIYALAKHPDNVCSGIIRRKTKAVFAVVTSIPPKKHGEDEDEDVEMPDGDVSPHHDEPSPDVEDASFFPLSQLLFIVGHVAVKQIVHMEMLELDFKRRKSEQEKAKGKENNEPKNEDADDLDKIGGTTEDEYTDKMTIIR